MIEDKVQKVVQKEVKSYGKLEKQVASIAFTVRKMKEWIEEKMGADIDGDGRVGGGPYKKILIFLFMAGMASFCFAENKTAIAYWSDRAYIDSDSGMHAHGLTVGTNSVSFAGLITVTGTINGITFNATMITNVIAEGQVLPAVDGSAVTNIDAANILPATMLSAIDISAGTNLPSSGVEDVPTGANVTNYVRIDSGDGTNWTTNAVVYFPFGGGYIVGTITAYP